MWSARLLSAVFVLLVISPVTLQAGPKEEVVIQSVNSAKQSITVYNRSTSQTEVIKVDRKTKIRVGTNRNAGFSDLEAGLEGTIEYDDQFGYVIAISVGPPRD